MIHIPLKYQFGNQLFRYALGRQLAIKNKTSLELDLFTYISKWDLRGKTTSNWLNMLSLKECYPDLKFFVFSNDPTWCSNNNIFKQCHIINLEVSG